MNILDMTMDSPSTSEVREWSEYQKAFFEKVKNSADSIQLEAVAGSGKSTTLCEVPNLAEGPVLFLAFMKANVEDLKGRVTSGEVRTFNSLGHAGLIKTFRNVQMDFKKLPKLLCQVANSDMIGDYGSQIQQCVRLAKSDGVGLSRKEDTWDFVDVIQRHDIDVPVEIEEQVALYAAKLFALSNSTTTAFDFDDQLYLPILHNTFFPAYGTIIVDEDQDLSPIQHIMLERLQQDGQHARIIGAGDRRQAIYAFRGALANSVDLLKSKFHMQESPLSISYRCGKAIVEEAKKYCPQIEARPNAQEGIILRAKEDPKFWSHDQMVLCRTNAPLFAAILSYVRAGRPCRVKSNFLEQLESFVRRFKARSMLDFHMKLEEWYTRDLATAKAKGQKAKMSLLKDKYDTLSLLAMQCSSPQQILALLKKLAESKEGTIFSTIHKAKGLEAERVYILRPDLMPAPWAESEEERQQEINMLYVAITRAKNELIFGAVKEI